MSPPPHNVRSGVHSDGLGPKVTIRRKREMPMAHSYEYAPMPEAGYRERLVPESTLGRLGLFAACLSTWLVVGVELVAATR